MAVDDNGPKLSVTFDLEDFKKGLERMDSDFNSFIERLNNKSKGFFQDTQKSYDRFFGQQVSNPNQQQGQQGRQGQQASNPNQQQGQSGFTKSEIESKQKVEQELRKAGLAYEEKAFQQRKEQIRYQQETVKSFKDFGLAVAGLASGGMGVKALLDFSHNMGRLETFLQSINAKQTNAFAIRNELRGQGREDGEIWGALQSVSNDLIHLQAGEVTKVSDVTQYALKQLSAIDPKIQTAPRPKGENSTPDEQFIRIVKAGKIFEKNHPQFSHDLVIDTVASALGGNKPLAQAAFKSDFNFSKEDIAKAKAEMDTLKKQQEIDREYQKVKLEFERNLTQIMARNAPEIIAVLKALSGFLDKHGEAAIMLGLVAGFATTLGLAITPLRAVTGLLKTIGAVGAIGGAGGVVKEVVKEGAEKGFVRRYAGKAWNGTKWVAGKTWNAAKWTAGKGVEASEWVERNPTKVAKGGLKVGALPATLLYEFTIGNITDAKPTAEWDQPVKDSKGNLTRTGRKYEIERAVDGKIDRSFWTGDYYVKTKDGTFVYLDRNFYDPIEQIKQRLRDKQLQDLGSNPYATKAPVNQNEKPKGGLLEAIIPSAQAGDLAYDKARRSGNLINNIPLPLSNDIKSKQQYLEQLEQQYGLPKGSLDAQWSQESSRGKYMLSKAGAKGDFGFMDGTAKEYGVDVKDFYSSARGAARYLRDLTRQFDGDIHKGRAAYNWGQGNLKRTIKNFGYNWKNHMPRETQNYVDDVERKAAIYRNKNAGYRPNISLPQLQHQNMIAKHTNNTNNASNTYSHENNGTYTINLNGSNATPQQVVEELKKRDAFPNPYQMMGGRKIQ